MDYHPSPMPHITDAQRSEIAILIARGCSSLEISNTIGCDKSTINRERKRNGTKHGYDPKQAKVKARQRRRYSKWQGMKINEQPELKAYIIARLQAYQTPEQISGRLKEVDTHLPYVSKKAIYEWLYTAHGQMYCHFLPSARYKPKRRNGKKKTKRTMVPNRQDIDLRPQEVNDRSRYGDCETDTIVSGKKTRSKAALSVLEDRKARYTRLKKIPNLKPSVNRKAIVKMGKIFTMMHTLTFDNGIETKEHEKIAKALDILTFHCHSYASWEKGGVENTNGRIRRFIPKGADINAYSDAEIQKIENWLNHTPRKCLNYRTPYEIMIQENLLTSPCSSGAFEG
jgi:IS30 family transposase